MLSKSFMNRFRRLDAYAKTLDDFRIKTTLGGAVTLVSGLIIITLVVYEVSRFLTPTMIPEITVDRGAAQELPVSFNITFPHLPCYLISLDVMDESGEQMTHYGHEVTMVRLDSQGSRLQEERSQDPKNSIRNEFLAKAKEGYCGPCYGANLLKPSQCCNTCEQVQEAYREMGWAFDSDKAEQCVGEDWKNKAKLQSQEGCNLHGKLLINKVRGNIHFSPGKAFAQGASHIHDVRNYMAEHHDFHHRIHSFQCGEQDQALWKHRSTPDYTLTHPLQGTTRGNDEVLMMYQYFLKIVPTQINYLSEKTLATFQYSASYQERNLKEQPMGGLPGVFFMMEFSPMLITYNEKRQSLSSLLTSLCAIVGGIFTVAGLIDGVLYRAERALQVKRELGKTL